MRILATAICLAITISHGCHRSTGPTVELFKTVDAAEQERALRLQRLHAELRRRVHTAVSRPVEKGGGDTMLYGFAPVTNGPAGHFAGGDPLSGLLEGACTDAWPHGDDDPCRPVRWDLVDRSSPTVCPLAIRRRNTPSRDVAPKNERQAVRMALTVVEQLVPDPCPGRDCRPGLVVDRSVDYAFGYRPSDNSVHWNPDVYRRQLCSGRTSCSPPANDEEQRRENWVTIGVLAHELGHWYFTQRGSRESQQLHRLCVARSRRNGRSFTRTSSRDSRSGASPARANR